MQLLPTAAVAEEPVLPTRSIPLTLPEGTRGISQCIPLSDGGAVLDVLATGDLGGTSFDMIYLVRLDATGRTL